VLLLLLQKTLKFWTETLPTEQKSLSPWQIFSEVYTCVIKKLSEPEIINMHKQKKSYLPGALESVRLCLSFSESLSTIAMSSAPNTAVATPGATLVFPDPALEAAPDPAPEEVLPPPKKLRKSDILSHDPSKALLRLFEQPNSINKA